MLITQNPDTSPAQFLVRFWVKDLQFELADSKIRANFQTTFRCPDHTFILVLEPKPELEYHSTPSLHKFSFSTHIIYIPFQKCTMQIIVFWHVATFNWSEQHCSIPGTCDIGLCALYRWNQVWFLNQARYGILLKSTGTQGLGIWRAFLTTATKIPPESKF
jgi:hypothetical protein